MNGKLQTFGYSEPGSWGQLQSIMSDNDHIILVDTRYKPYSRISQWNYNRLVAFFGPQYLPMGSMLGNLNYQDRKSPIKLADPDLGIARLVWMLQSGKDIILLCACKDYEKCHRKVVFELVQKALNEVPA